MSFMSGSTSTSQNNYAYNYNYTLSDIGLTGADLAQYSQAQAQEAASINQTQQAGFAALASATKGVNLTQQELAQTIPQTADYIAAIAGGNTAASAGASVASLPAAQNLASPSNSTWEFLLAGGMLVLVAGGIAIIFFKE